MTRYLALMAVTAVFAACSNPAAPAHLGDTAVRAAESAVATQEQVANTSSDGGAQASEGTATTVGRSSAGRTYRHLPEEFSPDACDVVYTLMDELASVIGDASSSLTEAQIDRLFSTQTVDWDTDDIDDIEELLNGVTLGNQEARALRPVVDRGYEIHFRHLWVWDWLHRECFAEFGEALSSMPERKAEMHVDFQRLDDLCMQLFRGTPNPCHNTSRASISFACGVAEKQGRECSAQFEDGALVAGEFSIRDP